jgi:hypothetical protein
MAKCEFCGDNVFEDDHTTGEYCCNEQSKKQKDKGLKKSFVIAWEDLIKFGDCPICEGDPASCPESEKPASQCTRRRNAMKHSNSRIARQNARMPPR